MVFFFSFLNNLSNRFVNFEIEVVRLNRQSYFGSSNVIAVFHNLLLQFYFLSLFLLLRKRLENVHIYIYISKLSFFLHEPVSLFYNVSNIHVLFIFKHGEHVLRGHAPAWRKVNLAGYRPGYTRQGIMDSIAISMRSGLLGRTRWPTAIIHSDPRIMDWSRHLGNGWTCRPFRLSPHRFSSWYLIRVQVISSRIKRFVPRSTPWRPSRAPISRRDH